MQIVDAIKNLAIAMKGSGSVEDITTDQIAEAIQYIADNWEAISAGIGGGEYASCRHNFRTWRCEEIHGCRISISSRRYSRRICI